MTWLGTLSRIGRGLPEFVASLTADSMDRDARISRAKFRAWHRGTREADYMIGGFFDRHHGGWDDAELAWFEALLDEDDVDIMAWALQAQPVPSVHAGPQMRAMQRLDYVKI